MARPRRWGGLPVVLLLALAGCRETGTGPTGQPPQTVAGLVFAAGDSLVFDAWDLDDFGDLIPASHTAPVWRVLASPGPGASDTAVTSIAVFAGGTARPDTLLFRFHASGDIEQYGFIAREVFRQEKRKVPAAWDRIAAFALPTNGTWSIGTVDTAGLDTLRGTVNGDQGYFIANSGGVQTVFHGFGVSLGSLALYYTFIVSDVPAAVLLMREETTPAAPGYLRTLSALIRH